MPPAAHLHPAGHRAAQRAPAASPGASSAPTLSGTTLTATVAHQGTVAVKNAGLLYPYTAVDANGTGFPPFALSGPHNFPSPAYIRYGATGPTGPAIPTTTTLS